MPPNVPSVASLCAGARRLKASSGGVLPSLTAKERGRHEGKSEKEDLVDTIDGIDNKVSQVNEVTSMHEAENWAEHIDPALKAAGWGVVEG